MNLRIGSGIWYSYRYEFWVLVLAWVSVSEWTLYQWNTKQKVTCSETIHATFYSLWHDFSFIIVRKTFWDILYPSLRKHYIKEGVINIHEVLGIQNWQRLTSPFLTDSIWIPPKFCNLVPKKRGKKRKKKMAWTGESFVNPPSKSKIFKFSIFVTPSA